MLAAVQKNNPGVLSILQCQNYFELDPDTPKAQIKVSQLGSNCLAWDPDGSES
jgi:hypothetical protein